MNWMKDVALLCCDTRSAVGRAGIDSVGHCAPPVWGANFEPGRRVAELGDNSTY